ncbi:MAG: pilus assembly PilX N-terminal domain-containing protein [Kiritimatiellae bacterium]|nr:pilus assembly PilX N-terminal domain-containing protein [Kiritimatiellia bacterium]
MNHPQSKQSGSAVVGVMILLFVALAMVASYLKMSSNDVRLTRITIDEEKAFVVAEAGLDYGVVKLRDLLIQYQLSPTYTQEALQNMIDAIPPPTGIDEYQYVTQSGQLAFKIEIASILNEGTITNGTSCRGSYGAYQYFTITCGCINTNTGRGSVLKQTIQAVGLPLIRFGVFYEDDLEILPGPEMNFYGPVHANGNLWLGGPLNFHDRLTAHGNIFHKRKDNDTRPGNVEMIDEYGALISMIDNGNYIDSDHDDWMSKALQRWQGNVLSSAHGTSKLSPPINPLNDAHDIIERPSTTNNTDYAEETEKEKFANTACLRIHIDSNGVFTAHDYYTNDVTANFDKALLTVNSTNTSSGKPEYAKDSEGKYILEENGAYDTSQTNFYDGREKTYMAPVDIYVDQLLETFPDLYNGLYGTDQGQGIVYITRDDPDGASNGVMPCIRLRNGNNIISPSGISIASDLPIYIEGNYNTNSTKTSLVAGDAVTLLSSEWQDARSTLDKNNRIPADTKYNTVIMTGNAETSTGDYNGGLENVLRFQENWGKSPRKKVTFRGSIIDLWYAENASGKWIYGNYYTAPTRDWGYDDIYRLQAPPGMTRVFGVEEILWTRTTWAAEGW